ncbi:MAG: glutamine--fructose-6-phosphate transaminase (isomerizing) [Candidatus Dojkabacteria bacterium]
MCGIFGFSGWLKPRETLMNGLKRLEYRGYDSWGIAYIGQSNADMESGRQVGHLPLADYFPVAELADSANERYLGIAHTRWATHGGVTQANAHPHFATDKSFALAQNGIVENFQQLKLNLEEKGYKFETETDTEVIVRLIELEIDRKKAELVGTDLLLHAVSSAFSRLQGRNTILLLSESNSEFGAQIVAIRNGSPLVVGRKDKEFFLGSDFLSFADHTNEIAQLENFTGVVIQNEEVKGIKIVPDGGYSYFDLDFAKAEMSLGEVDKGGYEDFMIKEIYEQPETILNAVSYDESELSGLIQKIKEIKQSGKGSIYTVGCGTAGYAAGQIAYFLRKIYGAHATELKGYETDSYEQLFDENDLMLAISQSGETADTIEPIEKMKARGGKIASIVNMPGASITKLSDYPFFSRTGAEMCVASTKAFTAQLAWGYLLARSVAGEYSLAREEIDATSQKLRQLLESDELDKMVDEVAKYCFSKEHFFVLGRAQNHYIALEGALKVKEISYKHFEGFTAGELKHGVIALIEEGTPVFAILSEDEAKDDVISSVAEVKARGAKVIGISPMPNSNFDYHIHVSKEETLLSGVLNVVPFQLLAYKLGKMLGNNVDKPRNLAKSVTVK